MKVDDGHFYVNKSVAFLEWSRSLRWVNPISRLFLCINYKWKYDIPTSTKACPMLIIKIARLRESKVSYHSIVRFKHLSTKHLKINIFLCHTLFTWRTRFQYTNFAHYVNNGEICSAVKNFRWQVTGAPPVLNARVQIKSVAYARFWLAQCFFSYLNRS